MIIKDILGIQIMCRRSLYCQNCARNLHLIQPLCNFVKTITGRYKSNERDGYLGRLK